jgi:type III secretion protein V
LQDSAEIIISHLREILRRHGHSFVGIQETQTLLDSLERSHPALVHEVSPKIVSVAQLADLLRRLAEERISLRNLREILGALAEREPGVKDALALTEHVRSSLRRQITFQYSNRDGEIGVFLLDSILEDTVREAIQETAKGRVLALPPDLSRDIVEATGRVISGNTKPVVLTQADIRYHLRRLLETEHPHVTVLSYQELVPEAKLQHLGRIAL